jgi:hypothetical protein
MLAGKPCAGNRHLKPTPLLTLPLFAAPSAVLSVSVEPQKKVLHDLRACGVNDAPALGFGLRASSARLDTIIIKDP